MKILVLVFLLSICTLTAQNLQRNWGVEYKDTAQRVWGTMIASDVDGNVCISLDSDSAFTYMIKYTKNGEIEWNRHSYTYPEQFKVRRPIGFGTLEYNQEEDNFHFLSIRTSTKKDRSGTLLFLKFLNNIGTAQGTFPSQNSSNIYLPTYLIKLNNNRFLDNRYNLFSSGNSTFYSQIEVSIFGESSRKFYTDTVNIFDIASPVYSLWDTKIDRVSNSLFHLFGYNQEGVQPNFFVVSKSDLGMFEDTTNSLVDNELYTFTSSDVGVPNHALLVRKMLLKNDRIYVCGNSLSGFRKYHPFVATIHINGELLSVDFPFGKERSILSRDFCFSSDSSAIIFAGENLETIQSNTISRPTIKGFSLVTKDTFSFDENDRLGRFLAVTATSNGTIVATGLDITSGPFDYMYTASYSGIPLSVNDKPKQQNIVVSPNPSAGVIYVNTPDLKVGSVTISNIYGQEVMKIQNYTSRSNIDVSALPSGFYYLSFGNKEKVTTSFVLTK